jgi:hypothetical protein
MWEAKDPSYSGEKKGGKEAAKSPANSDPKRTTTPNKLGSAIGTSQML